MTHEPVTPRGKALVEPYYNGGSALDAQSVLSVERQAQTIVLDALEAAVRALPVHSISGYEWECYERDTGCHYHWSNHPCEYGHEHTHEGYFDRDGYSTGHDELLDLARVLDLIQKLRP